MKFNTNVGAIWKDEMENLVLDLLDYCFVCLKRCVPPPSFVLQMINNAIAKISNVRARRCMNQMA